MLNPPPLFKKKRERGREKENLVYKKRAAMRKIQSLIRAHYALAYSTFFLTVVKRCSYNPPRCRHRRRRVAPILSRARETVYSRTTVYCKFDAP